MSGSSPEASASAEENVLDVRRRSSGSTWLGAIVLLAATLVAYYPALHGEFVADDLAWTTHLKPLYADAGGLWRIWTVPASTQQYYPLTATTFWIDDHLWGDWTLPYHLENVLLHFAAAMLFWRLLRQLNVPGGWLAAAIFSLHPTMVESVGWITERKNVLSLLLCLAALLACGASVHWWAPSGGRRNWKLHALGFLLFVGALAAKITAFALPPVMLLLAWWKRGRVQMKRDVLPLVPFFVAAVGFGMGVHWMERHHVGALGADWEFTTAERMLVAGRACCFYVGKFLWPAGTCFFYPRWDLDTHSPWQWLYVGAAVATFLLIGLARNRIHRGIVVGALCFFIPLLPVLGFMNVYGMRVTFVADRWAHFSTLPMAALVAAGVMQLHRRWRGAFWIRGIAGIALCALAILTWTHAGELRTPDTFWRSVLDKNPNCWVACNELGVLKARDGKLEEAKQLYLKTIELKPDYENVHSNLGIAYLDMGRLDDAISELKIAAQLDPAMALRHHQLGNVLYLAQRMDEAAAAYRRALELQPSFYPSHEELARILLQQGRTDEAVTHYEAMQKLQPANPDPYTYLGNVFAQTRRDREAVEQFELALLRSPANPTILNNLSLVLSSSFDPVVRNAPRALELAEKLVQVSGDNDPNVLTALASALAVNAHFAEASETADKAAQLASDQGNALLAKSLHQRSLQYKERAPN